MTTIAYQLYCSRNFQPLGDTLTMLKATGYDAVEGFGALYADAGATRTALDAAGLSMPSAHFGLGMLETDLKGTLEIARTLGVSKVIVPYLAAEDRPTDHKGWAAFATHLARVGQRVRDAGFAYGWHNHDFELVPCGGVTPLELIAQAGVDLELDLGWVQAAGLDPLAVLTDHAPRILCVHIKDVAPEGTRTDEDGWADVGHGVIAWEGIRVALQAHGIDHWIVEHDNPNDPARFAARSLATLQGWLGDVA